MATTDPTKNSVPDYGNAETVEPRQRAFGVLGFDDRPNAKIGGTLLHRDFDSEAKNNDAAGG